MVGSTLVKKNKRKKNESVIKTFFKTFFCAFFVGFFILAIVFLYSVFVSFRTEGITDVQNLTVSMPSKIVYIDQTTQKEVEFESLKPEENKIWVDSSKIPDIMKNAFIAIEDERFYNHFGFDLLRTFKAFLNWSIKRKSSFGGSTITQQLVKNLTQNQDKTASRKLKEILQSIKLENELSKEQILELYLNTIYLSEGCYGVGTASEKFFGKEVLKLNIAECASIAGITQYPTLYDPLKNPDKNKEKQKIVLKKMYDLNYISKEEYENSLKTKLEFIKNSSKHRDNNVTSYFVDKVIEDALVSLKNIGYSEVISNKMLYDGGLTIYSTLNPGVQNAIDKVYEDRNNFKHQNKNVQSSIAIIDVKSGAIVGLSGGIGTKNASRTLNRASQTIRQPGSTIKPLSAFAPAIEKKIINASTTFIDEKITIGDWVCNNVNKKYIGETNTRDAINHSINTIPVKIIQKIRPENSFRFLVRNLGLTSLVEKEIVNGKLYSDVGYPQLALGGLTRGVSVSELAASYNVFPNNGIYIKPYVFTKILNKNGKEIVNNSPSRHIAMSESTSYIMCKLLNDVVKNGTGRGAAVYTGIFTAGKTGTTSDNFDRWFCGFTPYYTAVAWYGYDEPRNLGFGENPIISPWKKIMDQIHRNLPIKEIEKPRDVIEVSYCKTSGRIANEFCNSHATTFYFTKDNMPEGNCNLHKRINIIDRKNQNREKELEEETIKTNDDEKIRLEVDSE